MDGFYGIVAASAAHYDSVNLPQEFAADGLRFKCDGGVRDDFSISHMSEFAFEITQIEIR
jgi:hypothetical protein